MFLSNGAPVPAGVGTVADRVPMFADANYYGRESVPLLHQYATYGAIYKSQLWVHVLVKKLARGTARLPFVVRTAAGDNSPTAAPDHPLATLLDRPTDHLDANRLWLWTSSVYDTFGEAFWLKLRDRSGAVRELQPMHPSNVVIRRVADSSELVYYYTAGVRNVSDLPPIPATDVVPFVDWNPDTLVRGLSPLEPLRQTLFGEDAARRATSSWWTRGARPSVALKHPGTLSEGAQGRLQRTWDRNHAGADLFGGTAILEEGMDVATVQLSAEEMQYIESRKLNREEVCAAFDVPPPVVHILDRATFSNITAQLRSMYRDTMGSRLPAFESAVAHHLVPDFDPTGADGLSASFDMADVLRGDFETRAESVEKLITVGVFKPSEARPLFGLNPAGPEADKLYANAALAPLGQPAKPAPASAGQHEPASSADQQAPAPPLPPRTRAYDARSLAGRLGRLKGQRDNLRSRLVDEHRSALADYTRRLSTAVQLAMNRKDAGVVTDEQWTSELADLLASLGSTTARWLGSAVAESLGGRYDPSEVDAWVADNSRQAADNIAATTREQLAAAFAASAALPSVASEFFDGMERDRVPELAHSRVAVVGGAAELAGARQAGARTKTWVVNSARPRASHARMHGQSVPLGESFPNGMSGPGDPHGGADEVAGCTCSLEFSHEG